MAEVRATGREGQGLTRRGMLRSLALQGGPFTPQQAEAFLARPYAAEAVRLRRWDELAKDPEMVTPSLEDFRPVLERALQA